MKFYTNRKKRILSLLVILTTIMAFLFSITAAAADRVFEVYYVTQNGLYVARTDGKKNERLASTQAIGRGQDSGNYVMAWWSRYPQNGNSASFVRVNLKTGGVNGSPFASAYDFQVKGNYVYYVVNENVSTKTYSIKRCKIALDWKPGDSDGSTVFEDIVEKNQTQVANMIDSSSPTFFIDGNYLYYTALKNGRESWVARKAIDGSGSVKWIAKGSILGTGDMHIAKTSKYIYIRVNTAPNETRYSTDCVVFYRVEKSTGKVTALNSKTPLDYNAVSSGLWAGAVHFYNSGIITNTGSDRDSYPWNYADATGYIMTLSGKKVKVSKYGIVEMADMGSNKYAYCDAAGDVYIATIKDGALSSNKKVSAVKDIYYTFNTSSNGKRVSTLLAGSDGTWILNADASVKQLVGAEWNRLFLFDEMDGYLYNNAGDENKLYWLSSDGKTNRAIGTLEADYILFARPVS